MGDLTWVLAVIVFWIFVGCVVAFLVRFTAFNHDDEEMLCDLEEQYFAEESAGTGMAPAT